MPNTVPDSEKPLHITVAVICRKNYILISKRAKNANQGDLWEFPGGKVEANESVLQALFRELHEELGITVEQAEPLITIPYTYPKKDQQTSDIQVFLDVWIVSNFSGKPYSKEKQPIKWVDKKQLIDFEFPAANKHILSALYLPECYVISPDCVLSDEQQKQKFISQFTQLCRQNYSLIQLRFKKYNPDKAFVGKLVNIAIQYQINLQLNSSLIELYNNNYSNLGIHLTSTDLYGNRLDTLIKNKSAYYSASCHNLVDIEQANKLKLDFIVLSPVNKTQSHASAEPLGWEKFQQLTRQAQMPVYALGGMQIDDIDKAKQNGAQGIAAISAFWDKENN